MNKLIIVVNVDWFFLSHRLPVALAAKSVGWDVTILTADTGKLNEIKKYGLNAMDLPMNRSGMNLFEELRTLYFLYSVYKRIHPDVVHHVGMKTILWGTLAAKFAPVGGVVNAISGLGGFFAEDNKCILSRLLPKVLRFSHRMNNLLCIFQNEDDWNLYVRNGIIVHEQGRFIKGSGVDLNEYCYAEEPRSGPIRVILTARMIIEKGVFILTEAANRLRDKYIGKVQFLLVGGIDDHPGAISKDQLEKVCDGDYIQWLGYRKDVKELLISSHIMAFPSYYMEGLPKSLIEADAIGRPIITTKSVGCKDAVVDGYNGFLIEPKDIDALTEKLNLLLSNKVLRQEMGKNSRIYAENNFSIEVVKERHLSIYQELLRVKNAKE